MSKNKLILEINIICYDFDHPWLDIPKELSLLNVEVCKQYHQAVFYIANIIPPGERFECEEDFDEYGVCKESLCYGHSIYGFLDELRIHQIKCDTFFSLSGFFTFLNQGKGILYIPLKEYLRKMV